MVLSSNGIGLYHPSIFLSEILIKLKTQLDKTEKILTIPSLI